MKALGLLALSCVDSSGYQLMKALGPLAVADRDILVHSVHSNSARSDDCMNANGSHGSLRSPFGQPWRSLRSRHARLALSVHQGTAQ